MHSGMPAGASGARQFRDTGIRRYAKICKDYAMNCRAVPIA